MDIGVIVYFVLGLILVLYWYDRDYHQEYIDLEKGEKVEKGMASTFLLFLWLFWPINMIKNIMKYKRI